MTRRSGSTRRPWLRELQPRAAIGLGSALLCGLGVLFGPAPAHAMRFDIQGGGKSFVQFESKAQMESFSGKSHQVQGYVDLDPAHLADSIGVYVEVDMASLDTGISIRNHHMCENHLETSKYPKGVFRGGRVLHPSQPSLKPGEKVTFGLAGELELHGVKQRVEVPVEMSSPAEDAGSTLHVLAKFQVRLSDYQINRPKFLVLKLDEVQRITVDLVATSKSPH